MTELSPPSPSSTLYSPRLSSSCFPSHPFILPSPPQPYPLPSIPLVSPPIASLTCEPPSLYMPSPRPLPSPLWGFRVGGARMGV